MKDFWISTPTEDMWHKCWDLLDQLDIPNRVHRDWRGLSIGVKSGQIKRGFNKASLEPELTYTEFLSLVSMEKSCIIKLNKDYTAEIKGGKVFVGCEVFEFGPILELAEKIQECK